MKRAWIRRVSKVPWRMCRTCHRAGRRPRYVGDDCTHALLPVGPCGQCGKKRPLVACHSYDFRPERKPVAKANPERQKKAAKRGAAKHRAYMTSETRKVVDARAGDRCEFLCDEIGYEGFRCTATESLQHHHKTYARYGGNELPTDILVVCKAHHAYLESLKPAGNRYSRRGIPLT